MNSRGITSLKEIIHLRANQIQVADYAYMLNKNMRSDKSDQARSVQNEETAPGLIMLIVPVESPAFGDAGVPKGHVQSSVKRWPAGNQITVPSGIEMNGGLLFVYCNWKSMPNKQRFTFHEFQ